MTENQLARATSSKVPWLFFDVAAARLGAPASSIEEILPLGAVTPIPLAPPSVPGLMGLRGEALPLLDLSTFFELASVDRPQIVLACRTSAFRVGLLCHRVRGIRHISAEQHSPPQLARSPRLRELALAEVEETDGLHVLLDIEAVLETARVRG